MSMKPTLCLEPDWSQEQLKILNSEPNIIVRGFAGSGKTLLAIHIAIRRAIQFNERVLIIVFTKTLDRVIESYLRNFNLAPDKVIVVFHGKLEYTPVSLIKPDVIIVDEFQDFTQQDFDKFLEGAKKFYFIGDDNQALYGTQYGSKLKTIDQSYLINRTQFPVLYITQNKRSSKGIKLLAQLFFCYNHRNEDFPDDLYDFYKKCITELEVNHGVDKFSDCFITFFKDEKEIDETVWLYDNVKEVRKKNENQTIAILVPDNEKVKELHEIFNAQGFAHSYKIGKDLSGNFFEENTTILTYHSAKGLEFDHVFLPFSNKSIYENRFWQNAYFTALTRGVRTLNISFSMTKGGNSEFRLQWLLDDYPEAVVFQIFQPNGS